MLHFSETPVEVNRTFGKATLLMIALLSEWMITQFGIISCERQVTDSVQISCMYLFPGGTKFLLPLRGQVLWHNVLNCVLLNVCPFFCTMTFQLPEHVVAATQIVYIFHHKLCTE